MSAVLSVDGQRPNSATDFDWDAEFADSAPSKRFQSRTRMRQRKIAAANVLRFDAPTDAVEGPGSSYTVCICGKFAVNGNEDIVLDGLADGRVRRGNVHLCGSVWTCPDCAQHVGANRAHYVRDLITWARDKGYRLVMTTLTIPHDDSQTASEVFGQLRDCHARFDSDGTARRRRAERGYIGRVRVIEVTRGANGWHFHSHDVEVYDDADKPMHDADAGSAEDDSWWAFQLCGALFRPWSRIVLAVTGKPAHESVGITVVPVWSENDYIAKLPEQAELRKETHGDKPRWGAEAELTKAHMKEGRKESRTPWEILDGCYSGNPDDFELFRDYARGTYNRSQIEVSPALAKLFRPLAAVADVAAAPAEYVFTDEQKADDGDQSGMVADRVLVAPDDQQRAMNAKPDWIDRAELYVLKGDVHDLPSALEVLGFRLELITAAHWSAATLDHATDPWQYSDEQCFETWRAKNTKPGGLQPNVWRAYFSKGELTPSSAPLHWQAS